MTSITLSQDDRRFSIKANEHTDSRVCAGISAILYAVAGWILNNQDILECHMVRLDAGDAELIWEGADKAETVYELAMIGLLQIEKKYPDEIKIKKI